MIKKARINKNLTQKQLAIRLLVSQSYISNLENKKINSFNIDKIKKVSNILNLNTTDVVNFLISN
ncbi:helix-turn-helix domain-containing protein [Clostridium tarantellae]|uniref:Helix-turn-helix domain-containing protein n=1 Tax=Clostridium tarantellae TaxID=39493 RepID=A0A6I1MIA7_9CLOT|nr:helix-turn-helix transcriptional regulator [Clostridium tarantellae]MPQ42850.1 helix-turn-helix domain-containing protein [Clostridium tarantellae]